MEYAVLVVTHLSLMGISFALGKHFGYNEAQPKRGPKGRFTKKD